MSRWCLPIASAYSARGELGKFVKSGLICYDLSLRIQDSEGRMGIVSQELVASLEDLVACFEDLEDLRSELNRRHPLFSVVSM